MEPDAPERRWQNRAVAEGLRERKRLRTYRLIQQSALDLIDQQGYDATTIEQIAAAAEISPSTFFRYFPTKEAVIVTDEYDPLILAALEALDPDLTPVQAFRSVVNGLFQDIYLRDRARLLHRVTLIFGTPQLRARILEGTRDTSQEFAAVLAQQRGLPPDDPGIRLALSAIMAVLTTVLQDWAEAGGSGNLPRIVDEGLALLESGFATAPRTSRRARRVRP